MFKRVEIFYSLNKCLRGFAPYGLVLPKGHFNFWKLHLVWILFSGAVWKTSFRSLVHWSLTYLKILELMLWLNLSVTGNQFRVSNSLCDICATLSNSRQTGMHLCWEVWILLFKTLFKLGYRIEQTLVEMWLK